MCGKFPSTSRWFMNGTTDGSALCSHSIGRMVMSARCCVCFVSWMNGAVRTWKTMAEATRTPPTVTNHNHERASGPLSATSTLYSSISRPRAAAEMFPLVFRTLNAPLFTIWPYYRDQPAVFTRTRLDCFGRYARYFRFFMNEISFLFFYELL